MFVEPSTKSTQLSTAGFVGEGGGGYLLGDGESIMESPVGVFYNGHISPFLGSFKFLCRHFLLILNFLRL